MGKLAAAFLEALTAPQRAATEEGLALERCLQEALTTARAAWPRLEVEAQPFVTYLAQRVPEHGDAGQALGSMLVGDLYLACACVGGAPAAMEAFEQRFNGDLEQVLGSLHLPSGLGEEVRQIFRQKLLVGNGQRPPNLAKYSGRGSLAGWLRVSLTRLALRHKGRGKRERAVSDDLLEVLPEADADPELAYLKDLYRGEFKAAFELAMASLSTRERNLLRHQLVDRLSIDQIGSLYRVHRSTAARWLDKARQSVVNHIRQAMMQRLRIQGDEYESIMRLIRSQVELSITRHLEPVPDADES